MILKILKWLLISIVSFFLFPYLVIIIMCCMFWQILMEILELIGNIINHIIKGIENGKKFGFKEGIQYIIYGEGYNNWW